MKKQKIDKEFLIKHHFWILTGTSAVLLLIAGLIVLFGGGDIEKVIREFTDSKTSLSAKTSARLVNEHFLPSWKKQQDVYQAQKNKVWQQAWEGQNGPPTAEKPIVTWPAFDTAGRREFLEQQHFGDPIDHAFTGQYRDVYGRQFYVTDNKPSMRTFLFPREAPSNFRFPVEGDVQKIFRPVQWKTDQNPSPEECWLAQEELCVRREVVLLLKDALDSISRCELVDPKQITGDPLPAVGQGEKVQRFRNRNWELDLIVSKGQVLGKSTIRNVTPARRPMALVNEGRGMVFRLRQGGQTAELEPILGVLLSPNEKANFGSDTRIDSLDLSQPFQVEQVFDRSTSPLKRIDALEIGRLAQSHRTAPVPLVAGPASPPPPEASPEGATPPDSGGDPMGGGGINVSAPGGAQGANQAAADDPTPLNSLARKRYIQVNDQVRRLPVAFTVQVEQAYIQDVLAAVANSRLRIQTTQVGWQHVPGGSYSSPGSMPMGGVPGSGPPGSGPPGTGAAPRPGGWDDEGGMGPKGMGPVGMGPSPMDGTGTPVETENVQRNLVDLTVYGIVTLYNRYPPKAKPSGDGTTPTP